MVEEMVGLGSNKMAKVLWNCFVMFLLWNIWTERNSRVIEEKEMGVKDF